MKYGALDTTDFKKDNDTSFDPNLLTAFHSNEFVQTQERALKTCKKDSSCKKSECCASIFISDTEGESSTYKYCFSKSYNGFLELISEDEGETYSTTAV